jgi:hypothetical protein
MAQISGITGTTLAAVAARPVITKGDALPF